VAEVESRASDSMGVRRPSFRWRRWGWRAGRSVLGDGHGGHERPGVTGGHRGAVVRDGEQDRAAWVIGWQLEPFVGEQVEKPLGGETVTAFGRCWDGRGPGRAGVSGWRTGGGESCSPTDGRSCVLSGCGAATNADSLCPSG
jgi:hypothetical protein